MIVFTFIITLYITLTIIISFFNFGLADNDLSKYINLMWTYISLIIIIIYIISLKATGDSAEIKALKTIDSINTEEINILSNKNLSYQRLIDSLEISNKTLHEIVNSNNIYQNLNIK